MASQNQHLQQQIQELQQQLKQQQSENDNGDTSIISDNTAQTQVNGNRKRQTDASRKTQNAVSKDQRLFGLWASLLNHKSSNIRHMPLDLDNALPGITLEFGNVAFLCHVDSCAAMSTGNSLIHMWIMSKHPEIVVDYGEYNDLEPFEPLSLRCAVDNGKDNESSTAKKDLKDCLTKYVTYRTNYTLNGKPATVTFGLGDNISVKSIVGLPFLLQWGCDICLSRGALVSHALDMEFPLYYGTTSADFPPGVTFHPEQFVRPVPPNKRNHVNADELSAITDGCSDGMDSVPLFPIASNYKITESCSNGALKRTVELVSDSDSN